MGLRVGAVFDGHGGSAVVQFAKDTLRNLFSAMGGNTHEQPSAKALRALGQITRAIHQDLSRELTAWQGATATLAIVDPTHIAIAWLGDSDAVICRRVSGQLVVERLTHAHKPDRIDEQQRIESAG